MLSLHLRAIICFKAQWIWSEGNSGGDNCPSMLIYTKNEVLTLEMFSFLEKKVEGRSESMKKAINNMVSLVPFHEQDLIIIDNQLAYISGEWERRSSRKR